MGYNVIELTLFRSNPSWKYELRIQTIQDIRKTWYGKNVIDVKFHVDVMGMDLVSPEHQNNQMRFDKVFNERPSNVELNRFIDDYHAMVRQSVGEVDWKQKEAEEKAKAQAELEERLRKEFEARLKLEKERLAKEFEEAQKNGKVDMGQK